MIRRITRWNKEPDDIDFMHINLNNIQNVEIGENLYRTYCPVGQYLVDHVDYLINLNCIDSFYADKNDIYYNYNFIISSQNIYDENFGFVNKWIRRK